jgi:hypothetical protein
VISEFQFQIPGASWRAEQNEVSYRALRSHLIFVTHRYKVKGTVLWVGLGCITHSLVPKRLVLSRSL